MLTSRSHRGQRQMTPEVMTTTIRWRRNMFVLIWTFLGALSYGGLWFLLIQDDSRSYSSIMIFTKRPPNEHQLRRQPATDTTTTQEEVLPKEVIVDSVLADDVSTQAHKPHNLEVEVEEEETSKLRIQNKKRKRRGKEGDHDFFDWSFWGLCICFSLISYVRIRLEPSRNSRRRSRSRRGLTSPMSRSEEAAIAQTLRRINRDRAVRGETPITMEAYRILRMALLQDRALLRGLAGDNNIMPPNRGATPEQIESCRQIQLTAESSYEGDCCICLVSFQVDDRVRILPCGHSYHKGCIDHWFQQSILCPICKHSLDDGNHRSGVVHSD